jgi:hypothetical protein
MTKSRDPEALLTAYLASGMEVLPDRVVDAVLDEVHRTRQRAVFGPPRTRTMRRTTLAAALVVAAVALGGTAFMLQRPAVGDPDPTGAPPVTPSLPAAVTAPSTPTASPVTDPAGLWIPTGTMGTPRYEHAAVRLLDGRVLVVGCCGGGGDASLQDLISAELYDPDSGTWSPTGSMAQRLRANVVATPMLLRDGKVLVLVADDAEESILNAEVYDPASGNWTATGQMVQGADFVGDTAAVLQDGKVLVAGLNGAQLYDPAGGTWSATGQMNTPRYYATATLLRDGRVLVAGGYVVPDVETDVAELYDPNTGSWTAIANMPVAPGHHTATLLRDGKVLVAGSSFDSSGLPLLEAEVYDPATGAWTALPVRPGFGDITATLLSDGRVLVTNATFESVAAELYDPGTGSWTIAAPMLRSHGTPAILLLDGTVLVAGGRDCLDGVCVATGSAELYVPAGVPPPPLPAFPAPPPPVIPTPTPRPSPYPPATGPVPPSARSWTVNVRNESSMPATLFLADDGEHGIGQLCGSVTPNVVPPHTTTKVTFQLPAKSVRGCWVWLNPAPGQGGSLFETSDAPIAGEIWMQEGGQGGWLSP